MIGKTMTVQIELLVLSVQCSGNDGIGATVVEQFSGGTVQFSCLTVPGTLLDQRLFPELFHPCVHVENDVVVH